MPINLLGITLPLSNRDEVLKAIGQADLPVRIATVNPEFILEAKRNTEFRAALQHMTHVTVDGSGVYFLLRLLGIREFPKYTGANLIDDLFKQYQGGEKSFFLLGGTDGYLKKVSEFLKKKYPKISIVGVEDGGIIPTHSVIPDLHLLERIQKARPDILLVGFGAPKQELWIEAASAHLKVPTMVGIGGALGFHSQKRRAPSVLQKFHLEWLFRALTEKGHVRRVWNATVVYSLYALRWLITRKSG